MGNNLFLDNFVESNIKLALKKKKKMNINAFLKKLVSKLNYRFSADNTEMIRILPCRVESHETNIS